MTSRRARIKGIANIPARRKNDVSSVDISVTLEPKTPEKNALLPENGTEETPSSSTETEVAKDAEQLSSANLTEKNSIKTEISSQNNSRVTNLNEPSKIINHKSEVTVKLDNSNKEIEVFRTADRRIHCTDVANDGEPHSESVHSKCEVPESAGESCTTPDVADKTREGPKFARRWVPKPAVKIPATARRSKPLEPQPKVANQNIENEAPVAPDSDVISPEAAETVIPSRAEPATGTPDILRVPSKPELSVRIPTDSDRTLPSPLSPSKTLNRARIRPSPKLIRRNSVQGSASESEDDGRRSRNRIRNDSVCSAASYTAESTPAKDKLSIIQDRLNASCKVHKLFRRSEQTRKVAEARREFFQKFGTAIPDKKRLTMMDLIYYNPTSNPMPKRKATKNSNDSEVVETLEEEQAAEETEDDPEETNGSEDMTPVPQVKVGPNGEIILDEQSLVIEQTGAKRGREKLANSQIVNIDDLDRAYGIYKRPKRARDWNVVDTLRFYKTLNTVGTDFSLMLSLFPGRTRRELKMKFKKEEKVNRALIDKALMNPVEFDFAELEQQLVADELALAADRKARSKRKQKGPRQKKRKSASVLSSELDEETQNDDDVQLRAAKPRRKLKDGYSVLENGLEDILNPLSDTDDDDILPADKKARLSRPPRACARRSKYTDGGNSEVEQDDTNSHDASVADQPIEGGAAAEAQQIGNGNELVEEKAVAEPMVEENVTEANEPTNKARGTAENEEGGRADIADRERSENNQLVPKGNEQNCAVPNILPNDLSTVEPGSLMILSTLAPDGQQIFKVFMVTQGQTNVPVNLSPDVVQSLTTSLGTAEAITLDLPVITDGGKSVLAEKPATMDADTAVPT